jgi:hypothetical protein
MLIANLSIAMATARHCQIPLSIAKTIFQFFPLVTLYDFAQIKTKMTKNGPFLHQKSSFSPKAFEKL